MSLRRRGALAALALLFTAAGCANDISAPSTEEIAVRRHIIAYGYCESGFTRDSSGQCTPDAPPGGGEPPAPSCDPTVAVESCDSGGGGGGGGSEDPEPSEDPCDTGDAVVDASGVHEGFDELWKASLAAGTEKGGWLVAEGSTFRLIPFQHADYDPCGVTINENPPPGAVGMVHTHPWRMFENRSSCGGWTTYTGTPSPQDSAALRHFGMKVGYFLDQNGIGKYTDEGGESAQRFKRCSF